MVIIPAQTKKIIPVHAQIAEQPKAKLIRGIKARLQRPQTVRKQEQKPIHVLFAQEQKLKQ